jgi:hypothetical protein
VTRYKSPKERGPVKLKRVKAQSAQFPYLSSEQHFRLALC